MVEEAAYYYLGKHTNTGKDNSSGDYKDVRQKMLQSYPCIERPGIHPWVELVYVLEERLINYNRKMPQNLALDPYFELPIKSRPLEVSSKLRLFP